MALLAARPVSSGPPLLPPSARASRSALLEVLASARASRWPLLEALASALASRWPLLEALASALASRSAWPPRASARVAPSAASVAARSLAAAPLAWPLPSERSRAASRPFRFPAAGSAAGGFRGRPQLRLRQQRVLDIGRHVLGHLARAHQSIESEIQIIVLRWHRTPARIRSFPP
jgi:hypothetical protein